MEYVVPDAQDDSAVEVAREMARDQVTRRLSHATGLQRAVELANRAAAELGAAQQDNVTSSA